MNEKINPKVSMGKKSRASGNAFELFVRKDLEKDGWIVSKWNNNVELPCLRCIPLDSLSTKEHEKLRNDSQFLDFMQTMVKHGGEKICENHHYEELGKLIPAKRKFNSFNKAMTIGTGFPDFVAFRNISYEDDGDIKSILYESIGVESKMNGILDKEEKEKCRWLLQNRIFGKILIASKTKVKNKIVVDYVNFEDKYGK
jgi:hypothetical protein